MGSRGDIYTLSPYTAKYEAKDGSEMRQSQELFPIIAERKPKYQRRTIDYQIARIVA